MNRFGLPLVALTTLSAVGLSGCADEGLGPVAPEGPSFAKVKDCDPPDPHPSCDGGEGGGGGDAGVMVTFAGGYGGSGTQVAGTLHRDNKRQLSISGSGEEIPVTFDDTQGAATDWASGSNPGYCTTTAATPGEILSLIAAMNGAGTVDETDDFFDVQIMKKSVEDEVTDPSHWIRHRRDELDLVEPRVELNFSTRPPDLLVTSEDDINDSDNPRTFMLSGGVVKVTLRTGQSSSISLSCDQAEDDAVIMTVTP